MYVQGQAEHRLADEIHRLIDGLPAAAVRRLYDDLAAATGVDPDTDRGQFLRAFLIRHLNQRRPHRTRRLFTRLVEPFLISDPVLAHADRAVPGAIQRIDAGGLWHALADQVFPTAQREVQATLDRLAADRLLDEILDSPEVVGLQTALRDTAITFLTQVADRPDLHRQFLVRVHQGRRDEAVRGGDPHLPRLDGRWFAFLIEALRGGRLCAPLIDQELATLADLAGDPAAEADRLGAVVDGFERRGLCRDPSMALAVPYILLNRARRFQAIGRFLAVGVGGSGSPDPAGAAAERRASSAAALLDVLVGHIQASCTAAVVMLSSAIDLAAVRRGALIRVAAEDARRLDALVSDLGQQLDAARAAGLIGPNGTLSGVAATLPAPAREGVSTRLEEAWIELTHLVGMRVLPAVSTRVLAAVRSLDRSVEDFDDLVWLIGVGRRLERLSERRYRPALALRLWRSFVAEQVRGMVHDLVRAAVQPDPERAFAHLIRLDRLVRAQDQELAQLTDPTRPVLVHWITHGFRTCDPLRPDGTALVRALLYRARSIALRTGGVLAPPLAALIAEAETTGVIGTAAAAPGLGR